MSVKHLSKSGSDESLANVSDESGGLRKAALFTVESNGTINKDPLGVFLLNPSGYDEAKQANWAPQNIPGQSDPALQWTSNGPRTVSFDALVTADTSYLDLGLGPLQAEQNVNPVDKVVNAIGKIASSFFKVTLPTPRKDYTKTDPVTQTDISSYLNYYRSLQYPTYSQANGAGKLRASPPLLVLYAGSSIAKIAYENRISAQHDLWVLSGIRIKITKQLPNLAPMEAVVSFQLTQYNVRSFDRSRFLR